MRILSRMYNAKRIVFKDAPLISVIVVIYDMPREAPRTLESLSIRFQRDISRADYEVIVVDNGSPEPLGEEAVRKYGGNFKYIYLKDASPSPAGALNEGFAHCRGNIIGAFIDGARLASPGLLARVMVASNLHPEPVIATLGWHLGPDQQQVSIQKGYNKAKEDEMLQKIGWPDCGYRLLEISTFAGSSKNGYFMMPAESNAVFVTRRMFQAVGGFDVRFDAPGGGIVNFDFYYRVVSHAESGLIILLSEGTFHQLHGGVSTNVDPAKSRNRIKQWFKQYRKIRGHAWHSPKKPPLYLGPVRPEMGPHIERSMYRVYEAHGKIEAGALSKAAPKIPMDFLCIGAHQCGTSWLNNLLKMHPDISLCSDSGTIRAGIRPLLTAVGSFMTDPGRLVALTGRVKGEVSPEYGILDTDEIAHIHSRYPDLRLIYIMRNPMERAWSHAVTDALREVEDYASLDPDIGSEAWLKRHVESRLSILQGNYERCLRNWLSYYAREQLLILKYEDILADPRLAVKKTGRHLGVDCKFYDSAKFEAPKTGLPEMDVKFPRAAVLLPLSEIYSARIRDLSEFVGEDLAAAWDVSSASL